jgi:hypothetical protein
LIAPCVIDPISALPPTISVSQFVPSNGFVVTLMPIELR